MDKVPRLGITFEKNNAPKLVLKESLEYRLKSSIPPIDGGRKQVTFSHQFYENKHFSTD